MEKQKKYKAVFIDWDDTIGDFSGAAMRSLKMLFAKYELSVLYDSFEQYYNIYEPHNLLLWEKYGLGQITKDELQFERFFFPLNEANARMSIKQKISKAKLIDTAISMGNDFTKLTTDLYTLLPQAADAVRYLSSKYPLTIISNGFVEVQYKKIERTGLADCFKHIVLSEEVGVQKPNQLIYSKALELNHISCDEAIMIGDNYFSDIKGAQDAGIDTVWITKENDNRFSTYKITDLSQIGQIL